MRPINADDVLSIVDDLRDRMTVEGYCAMVERIKALPSAQPVDKDIDVTSNDCISRQMLLEYIHGEPVGKLLCDKYNLDGLIEQLPSAHPVKSCDGCRFVGTYDTDFPCSCCIRREKDYYEKE